jgi:putative transposase
LYQGIKLSLHEFCEELKDNEKEQRKLRRKIDRQRRANNPENYEKNGTPIKKDKGLKKWRSSSRQKKTQTQSQELSRTNAAHRKSLHGQLINENGPLDSSIEKLS